MDIQENTDGDKVIGKRIGGSETDREAKKRGKELCKYWPWHP